MDEQIFITSKFINKFFTTDDILLKQVHCKVNDLYEDVRDGNNLLALLELLTQVKLVCCFLFCFNNLLLKAVFVQLNLKLNLIASFCNDLNFNFNSPKIANPL